ncbi:hypothetical protein Ndes2437B_g06900 [Nannochloris sp. 'desiccata']
MGFFTSENYIQALTMGIGAIIILVIMFNGKVDSEFSKGASPALALVLWSSICPPFSGFATLAYPLITIGCILGMLGYLIIVYLTYAVIGSDYRPGPDKAVAMCFISTAVISLFQLIRVRLPALDAPVLIAQLLAAIIAFLSYLSPTLPESPTLLWHMVVLFFIPAVVGSIVSMFVVPHPAGQRAKVLLGQLMDLTAELQSEVIWKLLLAGEGDVIEGKAVESAAVAAVAAATTTNEGDAAVVKEAKIDIHEGRYIGIASHLEPVVIPIHRLDIQAWQLAVGINGVLTFSALEFDVYNKPHIFPRTAFRAVLSPIRMMEHLYITTVAALQNGRAPTKAFPLLKRRA